MSAKWEYKVVYVDSWQRTSVEGQEVHPEEHERTSGFARRFLNGFGADGWELVGIQHTMPGQSYMIFKRELGEGAEPDLSVVKGEPRGERHGRHGHHGQPEQPEQPSADETVSL
jgi:hypothetical protein